MKAELEKKLVNDYQELYIDHTRPPSESLMCFGFECGDGWYNIVDALSKCISNHVKNQIDNEIHMRQTLKFSNIFLGWSWGWHHSRWLKDIWKNIKEYMRLRKPLDIDSVQIRAIQVKEKLGGLRFYVGRADDEVFGMIWMAEEMSYVTCEQCGRDGSIHHSGTWLKTLCAKCAKKFKYEKGVGIA